MREDGQRTCFTLGKTPGAERILLWDDLEGLLKWHTLTGWGLPARYKIGAAAFDGNYGMRLYAKRAIADGYQYLGAARSFPMVRDGILRAELVAMVPLASSFDGFGIALQWWDGVKKYDVRAIYESTNNYFMWFKGNCTLADTGLALLARAKGVWHRLWLEIDLARKEYVSVGIDGDTVQLDGNKICAVPDAGPVVAYVISVAVIYYSGDKNAYYDDVLCRLT